MGKISKYWFFLLGNQPWGSGNINISTQRNPMVAWGLGARGAIAGAVCGIKCKWRKKQMSIKYRMANLTLRILKGDSTVRWTPARWRTINMELVGWGWSAAKSIRHTGRGHIRIWLSARFGNEEENGHPSHQNTMGNPPGGKNSLHSALGQLSLCP